MRFLSCFYVCTSVCVFGDHHFEKLVQHSPFFYISVGKPSEATRSDVSPHGLGKTAEGQPQDSIALNEFSMGVG